MEGETFTINKPDKSPTGYVYGGFVSETEGISSTNPGIININFTMPAHDVKLHINWILESELTYVFTFNGKDTSGKVSTGKGATISVGGTVLATASAAGETITANIHPGDTVTVDCGERNDEKQKCWYWRSYGMYSIPQDSLPNYAQTVTFVMPNGPAQLTTFWTNAFWVTVKKYNGTGTGDPVLYRPDEQIDIDIGTYPGYAWRSITVRSAGSTSGQMGGWNARQGINANLLYFPYVSGEAGNHPSLSGDIDIEITWTNYSVLNMTVVGGGTGASRSGAYYSGSEKSVPISAGTKSGSTFGYWSSSDPSLTFEDFTSADTRLKLSSHSSTTPKNVTLTAHWDVPAPTEFDVTVTSEESVGSSGSGTYTAGNTVTIDAGTREGYRFTGWTVNSNNVSLTDSKSARTTFVMPQGPVSVTASWREVYPVTIVDGGVGASGAGEYYWTEKVTIDAGTKPGYIFKGWKIIDQWNRTFSATVNGTQASFTMPPYPLTATANWEIDPNAAYSVTIENAGTDAAGAGNYAQGATVTLNAGTRTGYTFQNWTVNSGSVTITNPTSATGASFTMPAGDVTVTANWTQTTRTLTIKGLPSGDKTETYAVGESVTLNAGTKTGYNFNGWAMTSGTVTLANAGSAQTTFTMPDADVALLATWTPVPDTTGAITLYLDELPGPLTIGGQGYHCGEPNVSHPFTGAYILTQRDPSTATSNTVTVTKDSSKSEFAITLKGVNIASADQAALLVDNDTKLSLTLQGGNTLKGGANHAGLELKATARIPKTAVTINGTAQDSLTATGGDYGAGIGGAGPVRYNSITINGGVITATGGKGAAGIGSGNTYASGSAGAAAGGADNIIINGGTVTAMGTADSSSAITYPSGALLGAAGIGAGYGAASYPDNGPYSYVTIIGGDVTATGVGKAPAIGGTYTGMIYISGGTVTTHRGDNQSTA